MKYVIIVGDGMGDYKVPELGHRTVLEAAKTPNMDALAKGGRLGLAQTIPAECQPGSDVANMAILGYDPVRFNTGRGPLEAASLGVDLSGDEQAFRLNLVALQHEEDGRVVMRDHSAGHLTTEEGAELVRHLAETLPLGAGVKLYPGISYRHLMVWPGLPDGLPTIPPHDYRGQDVSEYLFRNNGSMTALLDLVKASWPVLENHPINRARMKAGKPPANSIWPWGQGRPPAMATFQERWKLSGAVISAVDLIRGLGKYAGLRPIEVEGATGYVDTNYEGKVQAALNVLKTDDFVMIHIEAPDEAGHQGDFETKRTAVERIDERVVGPMWRALEQRGDYRLLVTCDHFTPVSVMTHTREAVPFAIYPAKAGSGRMFTEADAAASGLLVRKGYEMINLLFEGRA